MALRATEKVALREVNVAFGKSVPENVSVPVDVGEPRAHTPYAPVPFAASAIGTISAVAAMTLAADTADTKERRNLVRIGVNVK